MTNAERLLESLIPFYRNIDPDRVPGFFHSEATILWVPGMRAPIGPADLREIFVRAKALMPDVRAEVAGWATRGDVLFLEVRIAATLGTLALQWRSLDRFLLRGERIIDQLACFDATALEGLVDIGELIGQLVPAGRPIERTETAAGPAR